MTTRLRLGIVGADAKGQGWAPMAHFPALRALPEIEIAAICTTREETARAAAERYGVAHAFHDYRRMVESSGIDAVAVVVRAPNHFDVVMAALECGKPVYCEWPLGVDTAQAGKMAALARSKGVATVAGLQAHVDPTLRYVRDLVAQRHIGDVIAVTMAMISPGLPERPASKLWESTLAGGISALTVRGMHSLEAMCVCVGELVEVTGRVSTQVKRWRVAETGAMIDVEVPDNVALSGVLASGAAVSAHIATVPTAAAGFRLEIYGTDGALRVTTSGAPQRDANLLAGATGRAPLAPMDVPSSYTLAPADVPAGPPRNVAALYRRFAEAIRDGARAVPDFEYGLKRHRLIDAITRSSDEGRPVAVA